MRKAPTWRETHEQLLELAHGANFVAHNAPFVGVNRSDRFHVIAMSLSRPRATALAVAGVAALLVFSSAAASNAETRPAGSHQANDSPTGSIIWQSWGGNGTDDRWFTVRGDGSGYRELRRSPPWFGGSVAVSPDGRSVAGSSEVGIWRAKVDGSSKRTILRILGAHALTWSPSSKEIAFVRNFDDSNQLRTWRRDIYIVAADGSRKRHVATAYGYTDDPVSWSRDGRRILYSSKRHYADSVGTIYAVDLSTGARAALGAGDAPSYSPNGKNVSFLVKRTYQSIGWIYVAEATGARRQNLHIRAIWRPVWSPDSTALVGGGFLNDGLIVVRADGTKMRRVASLLGDIIWLQWTR